MILPSSCLHFGPIQNHTVTPRTSITGKINSQTGSHQLCSLQRSFVFRAAGQQVPEIRFHLCVSLISVNGDSEHPSSNLFISHRVVISLHV
ncbi:hypothetical protein ILYODFUR_021030 [Ilyodon furcidens]|uniref:Uncharacterized protein n=1 Tax=Ilyodon furcidens TaxID=33524 RepID=A0ABV0U8Z7_9TELE